MYTFKMSLKEYGRLPEQSNLTRKLTKTQDETDILVERSEIESALLNVN